MWVRVQVNSTKRWWKECWGGRGLWRRRRFPMILCWRGARGKVNERLSRSRCGFLPSEGGRTHAASRTGSRRLPERLHPSPVGPGRRRAEPGCGSACGPAHNPAGASSVWGRWSAIRPVWAKPVQVFTDAQSRQNLEIRTSPSGRSGERFPGSWLRLSRHGSSLPASVGVLHVHDAARARSVTCYQPLRATCRSGSV